MRRDSNTSYYMIHVYPFLLFKVNHKTEDEILRNLNRPAQRKLLSNLEGTRHRKDVLGSTCVSDQQLLERYVHSSVACLETYM